MPGVRRTYTQEQRVAAVERIVLGGEKVPDVARAIGADPAVVRRWKTEIPVSRPSSPPDAATVPVAGPPGDSALAATLRAQLVAKDREIAKLRSIVQTLMQE